MNVQKLTVGPIVGYTTPITCRIFGRGEKPLTLGVKCHGILRIKKEGQNKFLNSLIFRMNPIFDFSGVTEVDDLEADTVYEYEMGYFFSKDDSELMTEESIDNIDWSESSVGSFRTAKAENDKELTFIFGSCRYMLNLGGASFFDDRGDKIFRSMLELIEGGSKIDHCMMIGDQIYADDLNFVGPANTIEKFYERYHDAFTQPYISKLMSKLPTYMILDDHEIEDNWPDKANDKDYLGKYPAALHAYQTYQVSHSPVLSMNEGKLIGTPDHYWYNFESGCAEFFVMDSRTERHLPDNASEKLMIGIRQLRKLKEWLKNDSGKVKFIISSVPIFPDVKLGVEDKWGGFLVQRTEILNFIKENRIEKVVFLSGDVHSSLSAQISPRDDMNFKITSVISSSFFWPYPISRTRYFQLSGTLESVGASKYEIINRSQVISDDNFTKVVVNPNMLEIIVYGRKGEILDGPYQVKL